jgi:tRNA (cmo5U34)-methyltransferase
MHNATVGHFDDRAPEYEQARRRVVPGYDAFYGTAVEALGLAGLEIRRVLDLGAGTGLLAQHVARAHPAAHLTLLDGSEAMLAQARRKFGERCNYVLADFAEGLPEGGPWDAIVSGLAIHHLEDRRKRRLFERVHDALAPAGVFVNAEQVSAPTALFDHAYRSWHERRAGELGASEAEWAAAVESMRHDRPASVEQQLAWLREAGFADADCLWKDHLLAVLVARRVGAGAGARLA